MINPKNSTSPILITGAAGFIGSYLAKALLAQGVAVVGIDNMNDYYDVRLKQDRLTNLYQSKLFTFIKLDIAHFDNLQRAFSEYEFKHVLHMAAQAGIRYSIKNPMAYTSSNLVGFSNLLECCRHFKVDHFLFASSSSVYGNAKETPFTEDLPTDSPISYYAATKKANEVMASSYASLYGIKCTAVRLFTVYGPWGRPDMAPMIFLKKIIANETIKVFNHGDMMRDFTYISDVTTAIIGLLDMNHELQAAHPNAYNRHYEIFNIGSGRPIKLMDFIHTLEHVLEKKTTLVFDPIQQGDVQKTYASVSKMKHYLGYAPNTSLESGLRELVPWFKQYCHRRIAIGSID